MESLNLFSDGELIILVFCFCSILLLSCSFSVYLFDGLFLCTVHFFNKNIVDSTTNKKKKKKKSNTEGKPKCNRCANKNNHKQYERILIPPDLWKILIIFYEFMLSRPQ